MSDDLDIAAVLAALQDQIDELVATVASQQQAIEELSRRLPDQGR